MSKRFLILGGLVVLVLGGVLCWVGFGDVRRSELEERIFVQEDFVADVRNRAVAILEKPGHLVDDDLPNREEVLLGMMREENRKLYDEYMEVWERERELLEDMRRELERGGP